jgi:endo-1,4-beta-xylanase
MTWQLSVSALASTVLFLAFSPTPAEISLRQAAQSSGFLIGTAVRPTQLSESAYASTLAREFNMVEPENELKWESIHPGQNSFDFSQADQIVEFAQKHNMKIRGHTLVWHQQNPKWLVEGLFTPQERAQMLEQHIKTVVGHYRGKIFAWDVVNEAFDESHPGEVRATLWSGLTVPDPPARSAGAEPGTHADQAQRSKPTYAYIEQAFRWTHEADPQALLFYNDAEAEPINPKSDSIYAMVRDFRQRGVPINGVGFQMHVPSLRVDAASISANIKRFTALGVQVQITEMDVALPVDAAGNARPEDLQKQADIYRDIAAACLPYPGCTAIQTWGFTDKYSWMGSHSQHTKGAALLFDRNYRAKPAYEALRNVLASGRH